MKSGVLVLFKESGMTSHDAVLRARRLFGTKTVGHTGTLDPEATGVLPLLISRAAKAESVMPDREKIYRARVRFGIATDTEDVWGNVIEENAVLPTRAAFEKAMREFSGEYDQIPPMISAVKIGGKKLYEYAREGKTVERKARRVHIFSMELLEFDRDQAALRVICSRGTYIRTLLCDLCRAAGGLGAMSELVREKSGGFTLRDCVTLSDLEEMTPEEREDLLIPVERLFGEYPSVRLEAFYEKLIKNGCRVKTAKLHIHEPVGQRVRLINENGFWALGEICEEDGDPVLVKIKDFSTENKDKSE